jgi:hypothetical protein
MREIFGVVGRNRRFSRIAPATCAEPDLTSFERASGAIREDAIAPYKPFFS